MSMSAHPILAIRSHCTPLAAAFAAAAFGAIVLTAGSALAQADTDNDGLVTPDDPCPADPRNLCFGPVAVDTSTGLDIRLNAGGKFDVTCAGPRVDCNGHRWERDFGFNVFSRTTECDLGGGGENCVITGITELFGCEDEATEDLFQCEHADRPPDPDLAYSFTVEPGDYLVNLFFANTFTGTSAIGSRVMDISIEGVLVYDDFDQVVAAGGSGAAVVRSATVNVTDGTLDIQLGAVTERPAIKAVEVLREIDCTLPADCDDSDLCNGAETCTTLKCQAGDPVSCAANQVCEPQTGVCGAAGGACVNDTECIGAEICNVAIGTCQLPGGPCVEAADCAGGELCNTGAGLCIPPSGPCQTSQDCVGAQACNLASEICQDLGGPCDADEDCAGDEICDETGGTCVLCLDDTDCDDGQFCNGAETCTVGTGCTPGASPDCTGLDSECAVGACDEATDACVAQPANEGAPCTDDGDVCTVSNVCVAGQCAAEPLCDAICERCDAGSCESLCGNPVESLTSEINTSDALYTLQAAVGSQTCVPCICDPTGDGQTTASDALAVLRFATGAQDDLSCPPPSGTTTTTLATTTTVDGTTTTTTGGTTTTTIGGTTTTTLGGTTTTNGQITTTTTDGTTTTTIQGPTTTNGATTTTTVGQTTTTTVNGTTTTTIGGETTTTTIGGGTTTTTVGGGTTTTTVDAITTTTNGNTTTTTV